MTNYDDRSEFLDMVEINGHVAAEEIAQTAEIEADANVEPSRRLGPPGGLIESLDGESLASYNLRRIRKAVGVSQQQIADRLAQVGDVKLSQTQIAKIERGERPWRVNEMLAIAEALGVDHNEFFEGQPAANDPHMIVLTARLRLQRAITLENDVRDMWRDAARHRFECEEHLVRTAAEYGIKDAEALKALMFRWYQRRRVEGAQWGMLTGPNAEHADEMREEAIAFASQEWERYLQEAEERRSKGGETEPSSGPGEE